MTHRNGECGLRVRGGRSNLSDSPFWSFHYSTKPTTKTYETNLVLTWTTIYRSTQHTLDMNMAIRDRAIVGWTSTCTLKLAPCDRMSTLGNQPPHLLWKMMSLGNKTWRLWPRCCWKCGPIIRKIIENVQFPVQQEIFQKNTFLPNHHLHLHYAHPPALAMLMWTFWYGVSVETKCSWACTIESNCDSQS